MITSSGRCVCYDKIILLTNDEGGNYLLSIRLLSPKRGSLDITNYFPAKSIYDATGEKT